jgi:hypothetical protein
MERRPGLVLAWIALAIGVFIAPSASPQILLKPQGEDTRKLREQSLEAQVTIEGPVATTLMTRVFVNESSSRMEADFLYTLPPDTIVTYFAYWFGKEKVVARIVEKERAAAIYQHITSRQRDPALIELVGKNTFRARIFPIEANSPLKVEMTLAQLLPTTVDGTVFELPLEKERDDPLESLEVKVRVKPGNGLIGVVNNYGLPVESSPDGRQITLSGTNFRPQKDLRVLVQRTITEFQATLYAARSGGTDGFFALSLSSQSDLKRPRIRIAGVQTYDVVSSIGTEVKARESLTLLGRYRGSGPANITLSGVSVAGNVGWTETVTFPAQSEPNNPATRLWAARRIEELGAVSGYREQVIALSRRYTLPSRYTSWLAVPKSEMELYRREKQQVDLQATARRLGDELLAGRSRTAYARQLRAQLNRMSRQLEVNPQDVLRDQLGGQLWGIANELAAAKHEKTPNPQKVARVRRRLDRLARMLNVNSDVYVRNAEYPWISKELERVRKQLISSRRSRGPNAPGGQALEERFRTLSRLLNSKEYTEQRLSRLLARSDGERLDDLLAKQPVGSPETPVLQKRRAELAQRERELRARMGDPLITVEAPADAVQVVALLPGGDVKRLRYNIASRKWEARFDIPTYATEGSYDITLVLILADGRRETLTLKYHVDVTPPEGDGRARLVEGNGRMLRLELTASEDTARVQARLPSGEMVRLKPGARPGTFFALTPAAEAGVPGGPVEFILTDRAHNRTTLHVDLSQE